MKNAQTPQPDKSNRKQVINRKSLIVIVLVALAVTGLGAFLMKDLPLRERYSATMNELEQIKKDILEPVGAVEQNGDGYKPDIRGNGLIEAIFICGPDVACPTAARTWNIPLKSGEETEFAKKLLTYSGYKRDAGEPSCSFEKTSACFITAKKDDYFMSITLRTVDDQGSEIISPNARRTVSIRISDFKN